MAYATVAQIRAYLPQVPTTGETTTLLGDLLERVTDGVAAVMGFRFEGYAAADSRVVWGNGSVYLLVPPHAPLSITAVVSADGDVVSGWEYYGRTWLFLPDGWGTGQYRVTAQWGYGDPPPSITEVVLETAVNLWRAKDAARFSDVVGVAGSGAVGYEQAFTAHQRAVIRAWTRRFRYAGV